MDKPDIILLCGKKKSGKDTIAEYLVDNYNFKHYKITQKLKDCVKVLFNIDDYHYDNHKEEVLPEWGVSTRQLMQFIGTEMFQYKIQELIPNIEKNFWIKLFFNNFFINENFINSRNQVVVSDLRFIHEYEYIKKMCDKNNLKMIILKIDRNNIINNDTHISENELINIPYNFSLNNHSDISYLYMNINNFMKKFKNN